jgi:hypothetical protein
MYYVYFVRFSWDPQKAETNLQKHGVSLEGMKGRTMKKAGKQREPSRASLREMPEVDLKDGRWQPNPYAARIAAEGMTLPGRGRPKKGEEPGSTPPRSVRLPPQVQERLKKAAKARGLTVHAALRTAIVEWVGRNEPR